MIGWHSVHEALRVRPGKIGQICLRSEGPVDQAYSNIESQAETYRIPVEKMKGSHFDYLGSGHQGVACRVLETPELDWDLLDEKEISILIVLDEIEDPHNLGAVMRTAWLMGADGILTPQVRSAELTPTVGKIASGGAEHIPVDTHANLPRALTLLKEKGFWIYGLEEKGSKDLWEVSFADKVALVVGSEGRGIRTSVRGQCDQFVSIFQRQKGASYNASVAASLALGEFFRQHKTP
ncbi:MAG: 23S rRNA (guanosine(2251)-2'-O)-methyltransferase RlmB [Bdellovibrionaceae bacterium]|nr:23S rRNA (guanosine(2251)-2'-O)-methyltransferase RlmB [Bdellovibrionales bacterium]MCB9084685.1 23S rRNA (guanosine(2251)-2'-O)-methyltransferase RlmB [Pseudobdellovibrionaceae bacterium]